MLYDHWQSVFVRPSAQHPFLTAPPVTFRPAAYQRFDFGAFEGTLGRFHLERFDHFVK